MKQVNSSEALFFVCLIRPVAKSVTVCYYCKVIRDSFSSLVPKLQFDNLTSGAYWKESRRFIAVSRLTDITLKLSPPFDLLIVTSANRGNFHDASERL